MAVAAELRPCEAAPHRMVVTAVRVPTVAPAHAPLAPRQGPLVLPEEPLQVKVVPAAPPSPPPPPPAEVVPLTAELNRMHVTVSRRFLGKLNHPSRALAREPADERGDGLEHAPVHRLLRLPARRERADADLERVVPSLDHVERARR